jgi:hypothetical protein
MLSSMLVRFRVVVCREQRISFLSNSLCKKTYRAKNQNLLLFIRRKIQVR